MALVISSNRFVLHKVMEVLPKNLNAKNLPTRRLKGLLYIKQDVPIPPTSNMPDEVFVVYFNENDVIEEDPLDNINNYHSKSV